MLSSFIKQSRQTGGENHVFFPCLSHPLVGLSDLKRWQFAIQDGVLSVNCTALRRTSQHVEKQSHVKTPSRTQKYTHIAQMKRREWTICCQLWLNHITGFKVGYLMQVLHTNKLNVKGFSFNSRFSVGCNPILFSFIILKSLATSDN